MDTTYLQKILGLPTHRLLAYYRAYYTWWCTDNSETEFESVKAKIKEELSRREHVPRRHARKKLAVKRVTRTA